ncbi:hypothetical protein AQ490_09950 [Wenjunlia vitaminophila]|uniref:ATP-binding protein n=1 Tax=Wenjunlia vitaminophila TaxID=76728 RepID=A0A0T6LLS4_WENVI|nr:hypothetical protein [Wenjunlia vitaminophila]KRV47067.1 hypothetical protein AQ490_09950 [Wenjunlia vitaminophila]
MSLPLTRRIARVALLVAATATPVVGMAASASAAELPTTKDLAGLTQADTSRVSGQVDAASRKATAAVGETGSRTVGTTVPTTGEVVGAVTSKAAPSAADVQRATHRTTGKAANTIDRSTRATGALVNRGAASLRRTPLDASLPGTAGATPPKAVADTVNDLRNRLPGQAGGPSVLGR